MQSGKNVVLAGWVEKIKFLGKLSFITLRDREGKIQLTFLKKKFPDFEKIKNLTVESVVLVEGEVKKSKLKSGANEVVVSKMDILNKAKTPLPISIHDKNIETEFSKRLDNRFLDLRNSRNLAIFKIRQEIFSALREFFRKEDFIEVHTPKISESGAEGGATLFAFDYFNKKAYLSQSQQLYKQIMMAAGFEKVFEIGPSFRAEKSHTIRHVAEFSHLDVEMSFIDSYEDVFSVGERMLVYVLRKVKRECKNELRELGVKIDVPKLPFPRIKHSEAVDLLKKSGVKVKKGEELDLEKEKILGNIVKSKYKTDAYFISELPRKEGKFYWMMDKKVGFGGDLEYKGQEMFTGSQREHRYDVLVKQIKEKGMNPKDFKDYLMPFKYGMPPHGGFGLGVDRLTMMICGLGNIREGILFPRDTERLTP